MNILYLTDVNHTHESKEILAVCDKESTAIQLAMKHAKKSGDRFSSEDVRNINVIGQTQGYSGSVEYLIETYKTNELLD